MVFYEGIAKLLRGKVLFSLIFCVFLSSCYNDEEQQEIVLAEFDELGVCHRLESQYLQLEKVFYASIEKSTEVDFILREIEHFYMDTKSLRLDAQSCLSDLYDNYDDSEAVLNLRKKFISILSTLGKYESVIYTHMIRINVNNVDDELWMLKKMLDGEK